MDLKHFQNKNNLTMIFTGNDLLSIEIEYNRYLCHNKLVHEIYTLFNFIGNVRKGKHYECKNIIDRFIIECINDGYVNNEDVPLFSLYLNKSITKNYLVTIDYFKKMISELKEKKIYIDHDKQKKIENIILKYHKIFNDIVHNLDTYNMKESSLIKLENDVICINYKEYNRRISLTRFISILKNYDKPSYKDFIKMILRNSLFDSSNQQWSIGIDVYHYINTIFDISCEFFASPLNFNLPRYCSIFPDVDLTFGSICNFYQLNIENIQNKYITGAIYNPPYIPYLMDETINQCLDILEKLKNNKFEMTIICFLPHWSDADYIKKIKESQFTLKSHIFKKGTYMLHEKDCNKYILGAFELLVLILNNSNDQIKINDYKSNFTDLINFMKNEVNCYKKN